MFDPMIYVCKAIAKAFEPFRVGNITAYQREDRDFFSYGPAIHIEVENLPNCRFAYRPYDRDLLLLSPQDLAVDVAQKAYNHFFYRPTEPIDDHIILGEN